MKKILLAGSALAAAVSFASVAQAADVAPAATYDWTGFYIGANAGVAWNNSSTNNSFSVDGTRLDDINNKINGDQTAFTAGGMIGYNYQIDQIVLGAEADFNYLGFSADGKRNYEFDHGFEYPIDFNAKGSLQTDWFGTVRARLGYAIDNVLIYGTGGLAYGNVSGDGKVNISYNGNDIGTWKGSNDQTNWGWTVGGGMEYGIDNWSLGIEYLYVNLGSGDWNDNHGGDYAHDYSLKGNADYAFSTIRATAKVRF